ncbi:MAG: hypothetical protein GX677_08640 [Treponema sp.]|nr:hypothetical protein [Treponema sp.]
MAEEINKIADWEPGTLEKTRKNIGNIDENEAASMAKKLGGEVYYERTTNKSSSNTNPNNTGRIVRKQTGTESNNTSEMAQMQRKRNKEDLPLISKKTNTLIDKLMMSNDYRIKPNLGFFNFLRSLQKNGTEKLNPDFYNSSLKLMIEHMETFITVIKTLIQIAPATYKSRIINKNDAKFKFLRMVASWTMQGIKQEYAFIQYRANEQLLTADLIPIVRAIYTPIITVYYYGNNKIPKLVKEIYADEANYPDAPQDKLSGYAKQTITEWLYIDTEIVKKLYPLLMRMCSDSFESYPAFFTAKIADILKFTKLHKFDLLLPEKKTEQAKEEKKSTVQPPQKGIKDGTVQTGLKLLDQLFPQAGFTNLDSHPDLYPYFQPLYKYEDGFNMLSAENPIQTIMVLLHIIEDCFQGCRNINFVIPETAKQGSDSITSVLDDWSAYREDLFERLYCEPLKDLVNSLYSQADYDKTQLGKKLITSLLWQTTYHYLPNFKFTQLILEHPVDNSKYKPLFHRTDFARKYLTLVINECDAVAKTKGSVKLITNPWEHYHFDIQNEVSKRIDVLLGAQNKTSTTNATNANLLKYTLCFISVLDWYINNPESPAYTTDPFHIYRVSPADGKPQFSVEERNDQNKLFADAIKASYQRKAQ